MIMRRFVSLPGDFGMWWPVVLGYLVLKELAKRGLFMTQVSGRVGKRRYKEHQRALSLP